jgi:hypothetical protein
LPRPSKAIESRLFSVGDKVSARVKDRLKVKIKVRFKVKATVRDRIELSST